VSVLSLQERESGVGVADELLEIDRLLGWASRPATKAD
jgi:hypothetical protein